MDRPEPKRCLDKMSAGDIILRLCRSGWRAPVVVSLARHRAKKNNYQLNTQERSKGIYCIDDKASVRESHKNPGNCCTVS